MNRFTETNKWDDPWFRSLKGVHKLAFLYIVDRCNNAGFWEIDEAAMAFHTGIEQRHFEGAWEALQRSIVRASGWAWAKNFLKHQKNENINPANPAHRQILNLILEQTPRFDGVAEFALLVDSIKPHSEGHQKALLRATGTGIGKGIGEEGECREGVGPDLEAWVQECQKLMIPRWYAEAKFNVWEAKGWRIGRTPAKWRKCVNLCSTDFHNDGRPTGPEPRGNGARKPYEPNI